jgi:dolichol kinase
MAGLVGSLAGRERLFWNKQKSFQGLVAFLISAYVVGQLFILAFLLKGWLVFDPAWWSTVYGFVVVVCAFVETLPWGSWDNVVVYLTALLMLRYYGF